MPEGETLTCWVVTDGRRGIENQALGLAEAVARRVPLRIVRKQAPPRTSARTEIAARLRAPKLDDLRLADEASIAPDATSAPDLWIGCGRASLPYSERARAWFDNRPLVVQLQDPKRPLDAFDLVVPPMHDGLEGPNVFPILGSPNRITPQRLDIGLAAFESDPAAPPSPRAAVLIGGDSKRHRLTPPALDDLLAGLARAREDGWSLLITTSRRTPAFAVDALRTRFGASSGHAKGVRLWTRDEDGPNPYDAFLAAADVVLVTKDSTNMITEAASAAKPVLLVDMQGDDGKLAALYAELEARGSAKPFAGALEPWPVEPLAETDLAAAEVVRRLDARGRRAP